MGLQIVCKQTKGQRCIVEPSDRLYLKERKTVWTRWLIYSYLWWQKWTNSIHLGLFYYLVTFSHYLEHRQFFAKVSSCSGCCPSFHHLVLSGSIYVQKECITSYDFFKQLWVEIAFWEAIYGPHSKAGISNTGRKEHRSAIQYEELHFKLLLPFIKKEKQESFRICQQNALQLALKYENKLTDQIGYDLYCNRVTIFPKNVNRKSK